MLTAGIRKADHHHGKSGKIHMERIAHVGSAVNRGSRCWMPRPSLFPYSAEISKTAGSVMFLLGIGEILEEWTHKKSVDDLARSMSLNVSKVWLLDGGTEVLTDCVKVKEDDVVVVHMGNVIPFDGVVVEGAGAVNQASFTGEALAVAKEAGGYVYAGTVLEEGELRIQVKETAGSNKYEKIVSMIEETEKLKSTMEGEAAHLADRLVPYTLLGTALVYALTRNATRALSVLMVDFSCALKLAMPIAVLSAIREASGHKITVKGGRFLEQVKAADTIVFDKTGTLTNATPICGGGGSLHRGGTRRAAENSRMPGGAFPSLHGEGCGECGIEQGSDS